MTYEFDFVVIGANGMQGKIVAKDLLASGHRVLLAGTDDYGLDSILEHKKSEFAQIDLRKMDRVKRILKKSGASVVVNCAIDDFALSVTQACLDLGISYVDLGSDEEMTYDQFNLSKAFKEKKITGITGMGSTPGINNVMLRHVKPKFDTIETVELGFAWNSNMKVFVPPFSIDCIAWEFATNAKVLENGKFVERAPEDCKLDYDYRGIGKQRTYYTPHIEPFTFYPYLKDMGVKNIAVFSSFPDHSRETILKLMELGFTKYGPDTRIEVEGTTMDPLDATLEILRRIPLPKGYKEKENIWLKVFGTKNGKQKLIEMDALTTTLPGWEDATCNIDTGMPVSITAQMIKDGRISEHGMFAPEFVVPTMEFFAELGKRKIWVYENGIKINSPSMIHQYQSDKTAQRVRA